MDIWGYGGGTQWLVENVAPSIGFGPLALPLLLSHGLGEGQEHLERRPLGRRAVDPDPSVHHSVYSGGRVSWPGEPAIKPKKEEEESPT